MRRFYPTLLLLFCCLPVCFAQFGQKIRTGRPGKSIGAYSVGENVFQIQSGLTNNNFSTENPNITIVDDSWRHTTVLRYGITEHFEVSGVVGGQFGKEVIGGISNTQIGARYNFIKSDGARPALDLQARLLLPVGEEELKRSDLGTRLLLGTGNKLNDRTGLITNLGLTLGKDRAPVKFYAVTLLYSVGNDWSLFVEIYDNFVRLGDMEIDFDTGVGYFVNNDLKLDISTGWQNNPGSPVRNWFVDLGFSYRIHDRE